MQVSCDDGFVIGFNGSKFNGRAAVAVQRDDQRRVALFQSPAQFYGRPALVEEMTDELRQLLPQ